MLHAVKQLRCSAGQRPERRAQLREVARPRRAQRDSSHDSLEVADRRKRLRERTWRESSIKRRHRVVARAQRIAIAQRSMQPAAQHAPAHGRDGAIEHAGQRELGFAGQALVEFQIAAGRQGP